MKGKGVVFSNKSDSWETPDGLYNSLNMEFNFTLDPCATKNNAKCKKYYTEKENGLEQSWANERVFINPPYSNITPWIIKATTEQHDIVVMLLPATTDVAWFHDYVYNKPNIEIRFFRGRIRFTIDGKPAMSKNGQPQSPRFASMLVIFR